jgi:putative ABC transport system permease protein
MVLVGIANLIAWPLSYFIMQRWLSEFSYRVSVGAEIYVLAGTAAAVVALVTVSMQAIRAAWSNPVEALRYE